MPAGRPTTLTPEIIEQVCKYIAQGNYRIAAAKACGIPPDTCDHWLKMGRERPDSLHAELLRRIEEAEASAEILAAARIYEDGQDDPDHLKWWLERKFPRRWGRNRVDVKGLDKRLKKLEGGHADAPPEG